MKTIMKMVRNCFGVSVKHCCLSCAHKDETRVQSLRFCLKRKKEVKAHNVCPSWRMSRQLKMAGFGCGRVKRVEYLLYLASVREEETKAELSGLEVTPRSTEAIRAEFEQQYGKVFEIM